MREELTVQNRGWYSKSEYAEIIKPVALDLAVFLYGWNSRWGAPSIVTAGSLDTFIAFMASRKTVDGYYDFLSSYGEGLKKENNKSLHYKATGHIKTDDFSTLGVFLPAIRFLGTNVQLLSKSLSLSKGGNLTFQIGFRYKPNNFMFRLERGARSPIYNTQIGKSVFGTHLNIQKVGKYNYHLYLNPKKWKYFYK